jgi:hypothetical protein
MANDKKSIIKEALTDYNEIMEAAKTNAKNKLAEEFPNDFNNLLKEELQNKNKSVKESYKKLDNNKESKNDDAELNNKESVMKNQEKETKKVVKETAGEGKPFDEKAKKVANVEETVTIQDTVGDGNPFDENTKEGGIIVNKAKVEEDVHITDTVGDGDPFDEKAKKQLQTEEFDVTGLDVDSVGSALEGADNDDEILTMEQIEEEIANMENLGEELQSSPSFMEKGNKGVAYDQLVGMKNQIDEILAGMSGNNVEEMHAAGATDGASTFGDTGQVNGLHNQGPTDTLIDEMSDEITDADVQAVLGAPAEQGVDEAKGVSYSSGTITPGKLGDHQGTHGRFRQQGVDESKKKIGGLIEENKKLTKKLNETKKYKTSVTTLFEGYKTALEKYRNQLKEMAIFNTNLAHVNNLLVNEELALTQDDKIKIINEFKKVDTIAESQKKYKTILSEMKEGKKTISQSVESKAATSIQPSSKQKLEEVIEKTAYADNKHLQRMKKVIETIERNDRGKKII